MLNHMYFWNEAYLVLVDDVFYVFLDSVSKYFIWINSAVSHEQPYNYHNPHAFRNKFNICFLKASIVPANIHF